MSVPVALCGRITDTPEVSVRVSSRSPWWRRTGSHVDAPSSGSAVADADEPDLDRFLQWIQADASAPTIAPESAHSETILTTEEYPNMSSLDDALQQLLAIEGATGAAIVDYASGMALAQGGNPSFDLGIAAAGNSNVVRAKLATMRDLGVTDEIDDILITLTSQYHLINVHDAQNANGLFIYLVLTKTSANLALARHKLQAIAAQIEV